MDNDDTCDALIKSPATNGSEVASRLSQSDVQNDTETYSTEFSKPNSDTLSSNGISESHEKDTQLSEPKCTSSSYSSSNFFVDDLESNFFPEDSECSNFFFSSMDNDDTSDALIKSPATNGFEVASRLSQSDVQNDTDSYSTEFSKTNSDTLSSNVIAENHENDTQLFELKCASSSSNFFVDNLESDFFTEVSQCSSSSSSTTSSSSSLSSFSTTVDVFSACDDNVSTLKRNAPKEQSHCLNIFSGVYPNNHYESSTPVLTTFVNGSCTANHPTEEEEHKNSVVIGPKEISKKHVFEVSQSSLSGGDQISNGSVLYYPRDDFHNTSDLPSFKPFTSSLSGISPSEATSSTSTSSIVNIQNGSKNELFSSTQIMADKISSSQMESATTPSHFTMEGPYAILTNKENSCPFVERRISLLKPVKVGRAIARIRPGPDNAIFDCKVLSRNHALLWYQDGKFYLKDTCSSNGTFVNNNRLSSANEKSQPLELFSGDCVQFGVEVTEKKNVHSCVIASIRLFFADGAEANSYHTPSEFGLDEFQKGSLFGSGSYLSSNLNITPSQLIELSFFIKDALHKQCLLESQLESMKKAMKTAVESAKNGWTSLVEEDRLLSRIETLQAKIEVLLLAKNKDASEESALETLKQEMLLFISDKEKIEEFSKSCLQKALEEKMTALSNLQTAEVQLNIKETECQKLNNIVNQNMRDMNNLVSNCDKIKKEKEEFALKLKSTEEEHLKLNIKFDQERSELNSKILKLQENENDLKLKLNQTKKFLKKPVTCENETQTETENTIDHSDEAIDVRLEAKSQLKEPPCIETEASVMQTKPNDSQMIHDIELELDLLKEKYHQQNSTITEYLSKFEQTKQLLCSSNVNIEQFFNDIEQKFNSAHCLLAKKNEMLILFVSQLESLHKRIEMAKKAHSDKAVDLLERIHLLEVENSELNASVRKYEETTYKQNEEIEKFKCDIDVLNSKIQQTLEPMLKDQQKTVSPVDTSTQTNCSSSSFENKAIQSDWPHDIDAMKHLLQRILVVVNRGNKRADPTNDANHATTSEHMTQQKTEDLLSDSMNSNLDSSDLNKIIMEKIEDLVQNHQNVHEANEKLNNELNVLKDKYTWLSYQNELSFLIAITPLFIIFIAIIMAFYPILSLIMGTSGI